MDKHTIICDYCRKQINVKYNPESHLCSIECTDDLEKQIEHSILVVYDGKCNQVKMYNSTEEEPYDDKLFGAILNGYVDIHEELVHYRTTELRNNDSDIKVYIVCCNKQDSQIKLTNDMSAIEKPIIKKEIIFDRSDDFDNLDDLDDLDDLALDHVLGK